jgi:hypothetical protein
MATILLPASAVLAMVLAPLFSPYAPLLPFHSFSDCPLVQVIGSEQEDSRLLLVEATAHAVG